MYNYLYYIVLNIVLYYYLYRNLIDLLQLLDLYLCLWNSKFQFKVFTYVCTYVTYGLLPGIL